METMYYNVWILTIVSSLGLALVPFLIYRYFWLKRNICPTCQNRLEFYSSPDEYPDPKAQIARILQTIEQEKMEKEQDLVCPFCQEVVSNQGSICPNCGSSLKE